MEKEWCMDLVERKVRTEKERLFPCWADVVGRKWRVLPGVFNPARFHSTAVFAEMLRQLSAESFLEIGTGTGLIGIMMALQGCERVVATDICPRAVENCRLNARLYGVAGHLDIRCGDLWGPIAANERFDAIFWNLPFLMTFEPVRPEERAVKDENGRALRSFIAGAKDRLLPGGRLLIGYSSSMGEEAYLLGLVEEHGLEIKEVRRKVIAEEGMPVSFELYVTG